MKGFLDGLDWFVFALNAGTIENLTTGEFDAVGSAYSANTTAFIDDSHPTPRGSFFGQRGKGCLKPYFFDLRP